MLSYGVKWLKLIGKKNNQSRVIGEDRETMTPSKILFIRNTKQNACNINDLLFSTFYQVVYDIL